MIFDRQRRLLALLDAHGGEVGNLDFQKLLFLYCLQVEEIPVYEFVPYKFGGFSFTSYADRRRLTEQGLLLDEDRIWRLTLLGKTAANVPNPRLRKFFNRETRETREKESPFACFACFAVLSAFYIGMVFEPSHFSRSPLTFAIIRRGFGQRGPFRSRED